MVKNILVLLLGLVLCILFEACKKASPTEHAEQTIPRVGILSPENNSTVSDPTLIHISATDKNGIKFVELYIDSVLKKNFVDTPYTYLWDVRGYENNQSHLIFATATNKKNNVGVSGRIYVNSIAQQKPAVSIISPQPGEIITDSGRVHILASDDRGIISVEFYIDGTLKKTFTNAPYQCTFDVRGYYNNSNHTLFAKVFDTDSNMTVSETLPFTSRKSMITFNKKYGSLPNLQLNGKFIRQTSDSGFWVGGATTDERIFFMKVNKFGDSICCSTYGPGGGSGVWFFCKSGFATTDGGFIIAGNQYAHMYSVMSCFKVNPDGTIAWDRFLDGGVATSIEPTADGGYIVSGTFIYPFQYPEGAYIAKISANGEKQWHKVFGTTSGSYARQTIDGGYIVIGTLDSSIYLVKTDANGDSLWAKTFGVGFEYTGTDGQQTPDGGYIVLGTVESSGGNPYSYLVKTDERGNEVWHKSFSGTGLGMGYSVKQTEDGGYLIAGDILLKTNNLGDYLWDLNLGVSCSTAQQTNDGGYVLTGVDGYYAFIKKTDKDGNVFGAKQGKAFPHHPLHQHPQPLINHQQSDKKGEVGYRGEE